MDIFVNLWYSGRKIRIPLGVEATHTIQNVKRKIWEKTGIPVQNQRNLCRGANSHNYDSLQDNRTLRSYNIQNEADLSLDIGALAHYKIMTKRLSRSIVNKNRQIIQFQETNVEKDKQIALLKAELETIKETYAKEIHELQDECKQINIQYTELKFKYEAQRRALLDPSKYKQWDHNDIVQWIITLDNQKYRKYKSQLLIQMKQEKICGQELQFVDKGDLHRFGITGFADKVAILQHIKYLMPVKSNVNINQKQVEMEGDTPYI